MHFLTKFCFLKLFLTKTAEPGLANYYYFLFVLRVTRAPRSLTSQSVREGERENGWCKYMRVKHITVLGTKKLDANHKTNSTGFHHSMCDEVSHEVDYEHQQNKPTEMNENRIYIYKTQPKRRKALAKSCSLHPPRSKSHHITAQQRENAMRRVWMHNKAEHCYIVKGAKLLCGVQVRRSSCIHAVHSSRGNCMNGH